jgi:hypothetical protein
MSHSAENINATMLADDDMDDAEVLAPIGAAGATPTVDEPDGAPSKRARKVRNMADSPALGAPPIHTWTTDSSRGCRATATEGSNPVGDPSVHLRLAQSNKRAGVVRQVAAESSRKQPEAAASRRKQTQADASRRKQTQAAHRRAPLAPLAGRACMGIIPPTKHHYGGSNASNGGRPPVPCPLS